MADHFYGNTDVGRMRDNNEDAFIAQELNGLIMACVIDGVGGYEGGEVAAAIARDTIIEHLQRSGKDIPHMMKTALLSANEKIYHARQQHSGKESMACVLTLVLADLNSNSMHYAHVGDTRLYLYRDDSLVKLTKDHSFVGFLEDSRRLSEKEAMRHPKRNEINKALGFDPQMDQKDDYIEMGESPFLPHDVLLLCSDGLTDLVDSESIRNVLKGSASLQEKVHALIQAANDGGGKDNITVVLVQNNKKPTRLKITKPVKKNVVQSPVEAASAPVETKERPSKKASKSVAVPLLSVLCLIFLGAAVWFWWLQKDHEVGQVDPVEETPNRYELALAQQLNLATGFLMWPDSLASTPVMVSDTILLSNDSLHFDGNGLLLRADSAYRGAALFSGQARFLMLENITFENFHTAIAIPARALHLRNVRFVNCTTPVSAHFSLPANTPLNGFLIDTLLYIDTTQKTDRRP